MPSTQEFSRSCELLCPSCRVQSSAQTNFRYISSVLEGYIYSTLITTRSSRHTGIGFTALLGICFVIHFDKHTAMMIVVTHVWDSWERKHRMWHEELETYGWLYHAVSPWFFLWGVCTQPRKRDFIHTFDLNISLAFPLSCSFQFSPAPEVCSIESTIRILYTCEWQICPKMRRDRNRNDFAVSTPNSNTTWRRAFF